MPKSAATMFHVAAVAAALSLTGCDRFNREADLAKLDNQILENGTDPALTSALEDQILVDPALTQQSNKNAVRSADSPTQAQYPTPSARPGPVQRAGGAQTASTADLGDSAGGCLDELDRNLQWARRLPAAFAVFPGARLTDAAGSDSGDCRARVVTFTSNAAPQRVLEWYRGRAAGAGYSAEHQMRQNDHILAGLGGRDGGAFYLIVTPLRSGGSDVALIANQGG